MITPDESQELPKRKLSPEEEDFIRHLYRLKNNYEDYSGYVTTTEELELCKWNGMTPPEKNMTIEKVPPGTILKIVMVSRFGDCGLTDDLSADHGYHIRVDWEDPAISNIRLAL